MTVQQFIEEHSSSATETSAALTIAANYLDSEIERESSDNNFAACIVNCGNYAGGGGESRELILNGGATSFDEINGHEITNTDNPFDVAGIEANVQHWKETSEDTRDMDVIGWNGEPGFDQCLLLEMDTTGRIYVSNNAERRSVVRVEMYWGDKQDDREWVNELEEDFRSRKAAILYVGFARNGMADLNESDQEVWDVHIREYNLF